MSMPRIAILLALLPGLFAIPGSARDRPSEAEIGEIQVYLTPSQAVEEIFEDVARVDSLRAVLTDEELAEFSRVFGRSLERDSLLVLVPRDAKGTPLGHAVTAEEIGKYRPITFMVGTDPSGKVVGVEVLVYRESRGGEVRRTRFLRQYRGKTAEDPVRTNRDILNIAGATLSVNALNYGVKRVLYCLDLLRERNAL
jgi:Na+-translocating ferredoxin:NAD+ oxidoreductase RnfG subunit